MDPHPPGVTGFEPEIAGSWSPWASDNQELEDAEGEVIEASPKDLSRQRTAAPSLAANSGGPTRNHPKEVSV